jgi:subtilisin-like proprotein convertase family protein
MKSFYFIVFALVNAYLGSAQSFWLKADESNIKLRSESDREIIPSRYSTFKLDNQEIEKYLSLAPRQYSEDFLGKGKNIVLPMPNGKMEEFLVWNAPVMEEGLALSYPTIQTYKGYSLKDKSITVRFSTGPNGFHAAVRTEEGMVYIDPYSKGNTEYYNVYYTNDHIDESLRNKVICGTDETTFENQKLPKWGKRNFPDGKMELRKYRLALACTGEWGAVRGTTEKALSDMVTFVERANIVFEAELALTLVIIENNDKLIQLVGSSDPYTNPEQGLEILRQNTGIINQRVGFGNYEIGHVFSICYDVGGVAGGTICTSGKGAGVTCHNNSSISNGIVLVFNHEVGHQMTASHTFNNCPGNEEQGTSTGFEPGSGSTIMAYPGACGSSNLGAPRDNYYHVNSLDQILSYTNTEGSEAYACAEKVDINNFVPVIEMPYQDGFFIPKSTPFYLKSTATDANGDKLTYNWDQFDGQGSSPLGSPSGNAPIFRSIKPTENAARYFPNVSRILSGEFTNKQELLPTYGRDLTFRFVVRDNNPLGSAAVWEEVKFKVAPGNVGPFLLTFPINEQKLLVGEKLKVKWDVANTDISPVNCKKVDIYVALNNSLEFDSDNVILVAGGVPNDGEEFIIVPNTPTTRARIVVKATDNIFFTTGLINSRIDLPTVPSFIMDVKEPSRTVCLPDKLNFEFTTTGFAGLADSIKFEVVSGLPLGSKASFRSNSIFPGSTNMLDIDLTDVAGTADHEVIIRSLVPGIDTLDRILRLSLTGTDVNEVPLLTPANGISGVGPTQKYNWLGKTDATNYEIQVATSPSFDTDKVVANYATNELFFNSNIFLEKSTVHFWRVRASNDCRIGEWSEIFAFNTESLNCEVSKSGNLSINISQSGNPTVETELFVNSEGSISDLNVDNIRASHQWSSDIVAYLTSPSGKQALLWSRKCSTGSGINLGLDDQSNEFFQCPIGTGKIYRPESSLSVFNGDQMKGVWTLRLEDKVSGNGGRLLNFDLELCANITLNPPVLKKNETLQVQAKSTREISNDLLFCEDPDNSALELIYTLVSKPAFGLLVSNGIPMEAGQTFSQEDLNKAKVQYIHTADNIQNDGFKFIVSDGKGGWINITNFDIEVEAIPSSTNETMKVERILVYPNPANDFINIKVIDKEMSVNKCSLLDISGKEIMFTSTEDGTLTFDLALVPNGVYTIRIITDNQIITKKVVKQ